MNSSANTERTAAKAIESVFQTALERPTHSERRKHIREESTHHEHETDEYERDTARDDWRNIRDDAYSTETAEYAEYARDAESIEHSYVFLDSGLNTVNRRWLVNDWSVQNSLHTGMPTLS
jgi:hypothetical protein